MKSYTNMKLRKKLQNKGITLDEKKKPYFDKYSYYQVVNAYKNILPHIYGTAHLFYCPHNRNIVCDINIIRVNVNIISFIQLTAPDTTFLQHQFVHWS